MPRRPTAATTLEHLKKEAKRWLKALRAGDARAQARLQRLHPKAAAATTLRDVQHALALEHGVDGWRALTSRLSARDTADATLDLIRPDELATDRPYGDVGSRGCDVWDAIVVARQGDVDGLRRLLERDPKLSRYHQPLHFAARQGHVEAVRLLLDAGADPAVVDFSGDSLVIVARHRGHEEVAQLLEARRGKSTRIVPAEAAVADHAIHLAADANDAAAIGAWLDQDPTLAQRGDHKGATPLHRAVIASARDAMATLLARGADLHARHGAGAGDAAGYAPVDFEPIDLAVFWRHRGDVDTARWLIDRGATYDLPIAAGLGDLTAVTAALDADASRIGEARPWGKRALSAAIEFGHDAIANLLLARGFDPTWPEGADAPRGFALHSAARFGNQSMVEALLDRGADPNAYVDASGTATSAAKTPELRRLLFARGGVLDCYDLVWLGEDDEVVRRVKADPAAANAGCGGVFTAAATLGKRDLVVRLLDAGARVPPVLTACRSYLLEDPDILRLLLASGMDPDLPNWQRVTPLHDLCGRDGRGRARARRVECADILLDAGASLSARDEEYRSTPLAWAARNHLPDMVALLLARRAPTTLVDDEPWATPLAWAMSRGHRDIAEMLRRAGALA